MQGISTNDPNRYLTKLPTLKSTTMNNTQRIDLTVLIMAFFIALLLIATSCSPYGNKCLKPGQLQGAGYTKFNK